MNKIVEYANVEDTLNVELSGHSIDLETKKYRTLYIGNSLSICLLDRHCEKIFDVIDKKLHKLTYLQMEDKIFCLEDDLESANEIIESYREEERERVKH
jgi:hypothetical protein